MFQQIGHLIAQAASGNPLDPISQLTSLGIGALVAAPFAWMWRRQVGETDKCRREVANLQAEVRKLYQARSERDRELVEETVPMLIRAVDAAKDASHGVSEAMHRPMERAEDVADVLRRLEEIAVRLSRMDRRWR